MTKTAGLRTKLLRLIVGALYSARRKLDNGGTIMSRFGWFRKTEAPVIEHPIFGRLTASHRPQNGQWVWETTDFAHPKVGLVDLTFDADSTGPTESQEQEWAAIVEEIDRLSIAAAPLVGSRLNEWLERPSPADAWSDVEWQGAHISQRRGQFQLIYGCRSWPDAVITVYFEGRTPSLVQVDD